MHLSDMPQLTKKTFQDPEGVLHHAFPRLEFAIEKSLLNTLNSTVWKVMVRSDKLEVEEIAFVA